MSAVNLNMPLTLVIEASYLIREKLLVIAIHITQISR